MTARTYRPGDRVQRVRGHSLAVYRPTGAVGTVVTAPRGFGWKNLVYVEWDEWEQIPGSKRWQRRQRRSAPYHPYVLEPLPAVDRLADLLGRLGRDDA